MADRINLTELRDLAERGDDRELLALIDLAEAAHALEKAQPYRRKTPVWVGIRDALARFDFGDA